jgi:S1-C subfamily serine protease
MRLSIKGLLIGRVTGGGPAETAGLRRLKEGTAGAMAVGDIIIRLDGKPVESVDDLLTILDHHAVGDKVPIDFVRDGRRQQVIVTLQAVE